MRVDKLTSGSIPSPSRVALADPCGGSPCVWDFPGAASDALPPWLARYSRGSGSREGGD